MAKLKRIRTEERRSARRVSAAQVLPQAVTTLATGKEVKLINISVNGAILVHSSRVLSPNSSVRLRLKIPGSLMNLEGRVQRCRVIGLRQARVKYEAAIILDGELPHALADRLRHLDEDNQQTEELSPQGANLSPMPYPGTAELWVLDEA